jgi:MFS family permease
MSLLSFIFGVCYGLFEVILNVQATSLEKKFNKPMMSGFHAFWSIGLLSGSLLTSLFLEFKISFFINSIVFVAILAPVIFFSSLTIKNNKSDSLSFFSIFFNWPLFLIVLFVLAVTAVFLEGGTDSWGSLYMRDYINADGFNIGLAAIAFNGSMVFGRLIGDKLKELFGIYNFLVLSVIGSLLGSLVIALSSSLTFAIIGFIVAGLSVSSIIPICYTFGSSIENVNPTVGITIITIGVYGVFMIAPPALGYVADIFGIEFVYTPMLILFLMASMIVIMQKKLFKN